MSDPHPASYSFRYSVDGPPSSAHHHHHRGGDDDGVLGSRGVATRFGHEERRQGQRTEGVYYVALPDGRTQTVEYSVQGDTGYRAKVNGRINNSRRFLRLFFVFLKKTCRCRTTERVCIAPPPPRPTSFPWQ